MALGTFTPPPSKSASQFDPREKFGRPLIVVAREFLPDHKTKRFPDPRDKVVADVVDLLTDSVVVSVLWGSGAIVDRLKPSVPEEGATPEKLPVKIVKVSPAGGGNDYFSIEPLEGKELALAVAWDGKNPVRIDEERKAKEEADRAAAGQKPGNGNGSQAPLAGLSSTTATEAPVAEAPAETTGGGMGDAELEAALAALA